MRIWSNLYRICTCQERLTIEIVQNASDLIECLPREKCTYFWNHEHHRLKPNDLSIIRSTKWVKFHNQYNIESWYYLISQLDAGLTFVTELFVFDSVVFYCFFTNLVHFTSKRSSARQIRCCILDTIYRWCIWWYWELICW